MKRNLLLLSVILLAITANAQTHIYIPFPDSIGLWVDRYNAGCGDALTGEWSYTDQCDIYVMEGDTILSDSTTTWKKIMLWNTSASPLPEKYFGAIKEDTAKKVWLQLSGDTIPFVLYDFGLNQGDTFILHIPGGPEFKALVTSDVSAPLYRYLTLDFDTSISYQSWQGPLPSYYFPYNNITWHEGRGSELGFIYFYNFTSGRTCFENKSLAYYNFTDLSFTNFSCGDAASVRESSGSSTHPQFAISPNPATNTVTISIDESMIGSIATVTDITGRGIINYKLEMINTPVQTGGLANGIYLVTITGTGGGSATKKLIISK